MGRSSKPGSTTRTTSDGTDLEVVLERRVGQLLGEEINLVEEEDWDEHQMVSHSNE